MTAPTTQAEQEDAVREAVFLRATVQTLSRELGIERRLVNDFEADVARITTERDQLAADLRKTREGADRLTNLAKAAFHFFCCNDGIHRDDECGQLVLAMADIAKAIGFSNDPATNEEIAAVPVSSAAARAALTPDHKDAGGTAKGDGQP